jgi:type IV pilus assembly protein PilB
MGMERFCFSGRMGTVMAKKILENQFLGKILLDRNIISPKQLKHALDVQKDRGGFFGDILVDLGYIEERDVVAALVIQCHIPYIAIDQYEIDKNIIQLVPKNVAQKYQIVPLDRVNEILSVAMVDPLDYAAQAEIRRLTNFQLAPFISTKSEIERAILRWYDGGSS